MNGDAHCDTLVVDDEPTTGVEGSPSTTDELCALAPVGLLAELTHRCPLQCPYCSNPLELERANKELSTEAWVSVMEQAGAMGILQIHLSGGEPTARKDLEEIVAAASKADLYTNLITAAVTLSRERLEKLKALGLDHVQISFQDVDPDNAERIGAYPKATQKKLDVARWVTEMGLPLTINAPIHRQNIHNVGRYIDLSLKLGAQRLEIAHVQYYGWAYLNRTALLPGPEDVERQAAIVDDARERLKGILNIDFVTPDYYADYPKPCMGGWGSDAMAIMPDGTVLPCHAAQTITSLSFDTVTDKPLAEIWTASEAFERFRGTDWMQEPCKNCPRRDLDFGGCRCQAFAVTGDAAATDPACILSPHHEALRQVATCASGAEAGALTYRRIGAAAEPVT